MNVELDILQYIVDNEVCVDAPSIDDELVASGRVDSLSLLQILGFVRERFSVDLMQAAGPEDFVTIRKMADAVRRLKRHAS